jgi:hypothetical protein
LVIEGLRAAYQKLLDTFRQAVPEVLQDEGADNIEWRNLMCSALITQPNAIAAEEIIPGISPEFYMQIEWLPGARIENGELIFDSLFEEPDAPSETPQANALCDLRARGVIFNYMRELSNIEFINVGRIGQSLSSRPQDTNHRPTVYVVQVKEANKPHSEFNILRFQKWCVYEHLDEGKDLIQSIMEAADYTDYILDRRLGCRQLGMNLPLRVVAKKIAERYPSSHSEGYTIWSPYFEREYIRGMATDKLPLCRFEGQEFAVRCARLLGAAAAPNLIAGRCDLGGNPLFDDGDEVLIEDAQGMPADIVVADHTGTFNDYLSPLQNFAAEYAKPVQRRIEHVPGSREFVEAYLDGFLGRFSRIQDDYRRRRKAFDTLFKYRPRIEAGSFAYRWERVLARLDGTDPRELARLIRERLAM